MTRKSVSDVRLLTILAVMFSSSAIAVKVSEVELDKIMTFKVETEMGTFHWESPDGKSGWMSAFDLDGKDWITAGPNQRGVGKNSRYRGLPNAGLDDWGHPSRSAKHNIQGTTSQIVGDKEGTKIIIESQSKSIKGRWHCFDTHIALEVVKVSGNYHFLYEGTPGGKIHGPGLVMADGKETAIKEGKFKEEYNWPAGDVGEWFYIKDPNNKYHFWMAQTPATDDPGELWHQGGNMDLVSFGRRDNKKHKVSSVFTDTTRKWAFGFIPATMDFKAAKTHIEAIMTDPLKPKEKTGICLQKDHPSHARFLRVSMVSGSIQVFFPENTGIISLQLFDASGRMVEKWISTTGATSHSFSGLQKGVYFLKSSNDAGKGTFQKFIQPF